MLVRIILYQLTDYKIAYKSFVRQCFISFELIVQKLSPQLDIPSLIDQYVEHIHLASGGIINVDQDYFLTPGDYDVVGTFYLLYSIV